MRQRRTQEIDYNLLHEIARHGVHVNETLSVAARSLRAVLRNYQKFSKDPHLVNGNAKPQRWDSVADRLEFQIRFLEGLVERSQANNARIQNEITLVGTSNGHQISFN